MNNQNFQQFYSSKPSNGPTPEQLTAFQKQQQMFLQQQQQMYLQQQQLQRQMMREEQRNRLKNMNVKSMGVPTYQQSTTLPEQNQKNSQYSSVANNMGFQQSSNCQPNQHIYSSYMQNPTQQRSYSAQYSGMAPGAQAGPVQTMANAYPPMPSQSFNYGQPVNSAMQPQNSSRQPPNSSMEPANSIMQPANSIMQPANSIMQSANSIMQPANSIMQPANSVLQPVNSVLQPTNTVMLPPNSSMQPPNSVMKSSNSTVSMQSKIFSQTANSPQAVSFAPTMSTLHSQSATSTATFSSLAGSKITNLVPSSSSFASSPGPGNDVWSDFSGDQTTSVFSSLPINSIDSNQPTASLFDSKIQPPIRVGRSDSDEFGDFTVSEPAAQKESIPEEIKESTSSLSSSNGLPSFGLLTSNSNTYDFDEFFKAESSLSTRPETVSNFPSTFQNMSPLNTGSENRGQPVSSGIMHSELSSDTIPVTGNESLFGDSMSSLFTPVQSSIVGTSKEADFDEFDDFQAALPASTQGVTSSPSAIAAALVHSDKPSSKLNSHLEDVYVPGSMKNENADVIHSVTMFSNPISVEMTPKSSTSEFDKLISKSLSGKPSKSDVKSLFKPASKPSIPSVKSNITASDKAADWGSLDLSSVFQVQSQEAEEDDFGDFSSTVAEQTPKDDIYDVAASLPSKTSESPDDLFSIFSSKPSKSYGKVPFISEGTTDLEKTKVGITDLLGITTPKPPETKGEFNLVVDLFSSKSSSNKNKAKSESSDLDWSDFTSSFAPQEANKSPAPIIDIAPLASSSSSVLNMEKIPSLYKDIIEFCDTPSGIIDVGKVYEIMLTDKFKVVALQPLMSQCKMMANPTAKDLVDLIGLVGLKQKGFPTPSKYELNYNKLAIPSINMSVLKKKKTEKKAEKSEQPTLLSFVSQEPKASSLAPVFDFGGSSTKDLSSAPFAGEASSSNNTDSVFAPEPAGIDEDDDWGDFGSVSQSSDNGFSWGMNQVALTSSANVSKRNSIIDLLQEPIPPPKPSPALTVSLPNTRNAVPLKSDEPPPLSDNDDEDWADFAHPAHKWDIDLDEIEGQAVSNAASKNRWGTMSVTSDKVMGVDNYHDKDYSHIKVEVEETKTNQPDFFAADSLTTSFPKVDLPNACIETKSTQSEKPPEGDVNDNHVPDVGNVSAETEASVKPKADQKNLDKLASPTETNQFESPFGNFSNAPIKPFDAFFEESAHSEEASKDASSFDSPFAEFNTAIKKVTDPGDFGDFTSTSDPSSSDKNVDFVSAFADFETEGSKAPEELNASTKEMMEYGDFGDFASTSDPASNSKNAAFVPAFADFGAEGTKAPEEDDEFSDFCGTTEDQELPKDTLTESLKLTNLPKKDLDGFWNDMVHTLGSKNDNIPVFDLAEETHKKAKISDDLVTVPSVPAPVSYDALKSDSFDNEEDRIGAWSKCLSMILTVLLQCQNLLGSSSTPSVKQEIVDSEKGKLYLDCCTEVFRVACRISVAGACDDGVVEIFKEIKHTWSLISESLDDSLDLPTIRDFNIHSAEVVDEFSGRNCGICLLDTGVENKNSKLRYNGVFYHVTCANLWVNTVNPLLPNLNCKLDVPLL